MASKPPNDYVLSLRCNLKSPQFASIYINFKPHPKYSLHQLVVNFKKVSHFSLVITSTPTILLLPSSIHTFM